jgi:hypothetical protein
MGIMEDNRLDSHPQTILRRVSRYASFRIGRNAEIALNFQRSST